MFAQKHCNYRHSAIETLPLFIEGVPEGGGSITTQPTSYLAFARYDIGTM